MSDLDIFGSFVKGAKKGYNEGGSPKNIILTIIVLIVVACYFIQQWTSIPLFDWLVSLVKWIFDSIEKMLS